MMDQRSIEHFKKLEKDNQNKTKSLKETNLVLEACKKEHEKLYLQHENLKKNLEEQQEELLKYRNHYRGNRTTNQTSQDRNIKLSNARLMKKN